MNLFVKVFIIWLISIKTQIFHCLTICWPAFDKICQLEPCSPFLSLSSLDTSLPFHLPHCRKDSSSFWNFCAMGNRKFSIVELLLPLFLFSLSFHFFFLSGCCMASCMCVVTRSTVALQAGSRFSSISSNELTFVSTCFCHVTDFSGLRLLNDRSV